MSNDKTSLVYAMPLRWTTNMQVAKPVKMRTIDYFIFQVFNPTL